MSAYEHKILTYETAVDLAHLLKSSTYSLVITNGCFDIIHAGHVEFLAAARQHGDKLMVGVNTDEAVRALKGSTRPVNPLANRMVVLSALMAVSYVVPIDDMTMCLFIRDMKAAAWIKGGDYNLETLDRGEVNAAREVGTNVKIIPVVHQVSTTEIIKKVQTWEHTQ